MKILIIDSSYLAYKSYFAFSKKHLTIKIEGVEIITSAIFGFIRELINLTHNKEYDFIALAWDSPPYIKKDKYPTYKENRKKDVPMLAEEKNIIKAITYDLNIPSVLAKGYEGEETAASLIEKLWPNSIDIYTNDEDCYVLLSPKTHIVNTKQSSIIKFTVNDLMKKYKVTPKQFRTMKILMGCRTDNIAGIEKVGPVTASWLVNKYGTTKNIINNWKEIKKEKPSIINNLLKAYQTDIIKKAKYLTKINKPKFLKEIKPQTTIPYEMILEVLEAKTLLTGSNKMVLKYIQKSQAKHAINIKEKINAS
jgi:DNA polymerase I